VTLLCLSAACLDHCLSLFVSLPLPLSALVFIVIKLQMDPHAFDPSLQKTSPSNDPAASTSASNLSMDPTIRLVRLRQGNCTLEDHIQKFLDIAYFSDLPDCALIDFFGYGLNEPLKDYLLINGPRGSFVEFLDFALLTVGSLFTVGVAEERDTSSPHVMAASKESQDSYRNRERVLYKQAKYTLEKEIKVAKRNYSKKLRNQFYSGDSSSVWKGLQDITNYKTPSPSTVVNQQLADELNEFYCRFEKTPLTPPTTSLSPTPPPQISEDDVCQVFRKNKSKKAPGPDGVTPACLKTCADQLAPIFSQIFSRSLELCEVPASNAPPSSLFQRNPR